MSVSITSLCTSARWRLGDWWLNSLIKLKFARKGHGRGPTVWAPSCPSGNYFEYQAFAIGSRSQAAKTYLERKFEDFADYTHDELIKDALFAIKETLQGEKLTSSICTVAVLGVGESFHVIDQNTIRQLIESQEIGEEAPAAADASAPASDEQGGPQESEAAPMDI